MTSQEIIAFLLGIVAANLLRSLFSRPVGVDGARLARLEQKLDQILNRSSGVGSFPAPMILEGGAVSASSQVMDEIRHGKKIQAIKLYREQTGVGLKEAKDAVEALARQIQ
jgi:large subunit ribosomal protein L7/L12